MFCFHTKRVELSQQVTGYTILPGSGKTVSKVTTTYKCSKCSKVFTRKGLK
ncbi:hypothetical protein VPHK460_0202 [Vibrio phage K460]